ncbi:hypothetical protein DMN91_011726, partial [Ooceraea biroi]
MGTMG